MKKFKTPIAFIIFNRPDTTQLVFNEIKKIKPPKLFVISDGPRNDKEKNLVEKTRNIIDQVDWECEIYKNYSDKNLGCKTRVSSGIDWFFKNVEQGIILEDDCIPSQSFFFFCNELLDKYSKEEKVMMISGDNFYPEKIKYLDSYFFSQKNFNIWGWATWRRAWEKYDVNMTDWEITKKECPFKITRTTTTEEINRINAIEKTYKGLIDTWDYQWLYACLKNKGLSIIPCQNLISNIGFDERATHTNNPQNSLANLKRKKIFFPLKHPVKIINSDNYTTLIEKKETKKIILKLMNYLKKIWTKSPKEIFEKIFNPLKSDPKKTYRQTILVNDGFIKGMKLRVSNTMNKTEESMINGKYEEDLIEILTSHIKLFEHKNIWDIGAHIGYHSLVFSKFVEEGGKVIAIEPNPENFSILKENISENNQATNIIIARNEAISDIIGEITMNICKESNHISSSGGYLNNVQPPLSAKSYENFKKITIPSSTIDLLVYEKKLPSPNIIKIDVEGAELKVLLGAKETIKNIRPTFIIEIHSIPMMFYVYKLLREGGYKIKLIDEESNFFTKNIIAIPEK